MKKLKFIVAFFCIFSLINIYSNVFSEDDTQQNSQTQYKAKVTEVLRTQKESVELNSETDGQADVQSEPNVNEYVKVKILSDGIYKNQEFEAIYCIKASGLMENPTLEKGKTVFVLMEKNDEGNTTVTVTDTYRIDYLLITVFIFLGIILLIGKLKGIKTLISIALTLLFIIYMLIPLIIHGHNAILSSILTCMLIAIVSLILVGGFNKKSIVAIIGTIFGVVIAGFLAIIISKLADITGLTNEEAQMLIYISQDISIDIKGIFFASILIGAVGATMDISMSISSTMMEITQNVKNISVKDLIKSGLNVGKDSMGTMSNTLILAYVGESLNLIILLVLNNANLITILNSDYIASEILRSLCGTIGMLTSIPITAILYGVIYGVLDKNPILEKNNLN